MLSIFLDYFFLFFIYSVIGWFMETIFVGIQKKRIVDRGFLIGPYCPIYGVGALVMIFYLTQYKDNILTVFILGVVICSLLEYFTSYVMEKLFKTRWWDYSNNKFNLNGRICGFNSLLFGIAGVLVIYFVQPSLDLFLSRLNDTFLIIINVICFVLFFVDMIISLRVANKFKNTIKGINFKKDSTEDFSRLVRETIMNNNKILQQRLYFAFPGIDLKRFRDLKDNISSDIKGLLKR